MRVSTPSIPCALGRLVPQSAASADELKAMRAAAWHQHGVVVVPLAELHDDWDRQFLTGIASRLYGARTQRSRDGRPWQEGEIVERHDGETWTVIAATEKSAVLQRSRDGALTTLAQPGKEKS